MSSGALLGLASGALVAVESCVLPTFEVGTPPSDGGADDVIEAGPAACGKTYPDPPAVPDGSLKKDFVVALRSVDLGEGSTNPPGYDLDRQCSCINDAGPTCVSTLQQCDAPEGVDNSMAKLMNLVSLALGAGSFGSSYFSTQANNGSWSALVRVRGYNGEPDDPEVDVALFASPGMGAGNPQPAWNGDDVWPVTASSVLQGDLEMPVYHAKGAYVSGGVLVAAIPTAALTISGGTESITITISGGVLTGRLQAFGGAYRIREGVLAGRWFEHDLFLSLSSYRDSNGKPLCTDSLLGYGNIKNAACKGRDILKDATGAKSLPCDSLSIGIGFEADPAVLGAVTAPPVPTPGCPTATDPANDSCE